MGSEALAFEAGDIELRGFGDMHHGHDSGLDGVGDHQVSCIGDTPGHVEADHGNAVLLSELADGKGDFSSHEAPCKNQDGGAGEMGHGTYGFGDALFANERDGVYAYLFASDVVTVCFRHSSGDHLSYLRTASDHYHALAKDASGRVGEFHRDNAREGPEFLLECFLILDEIDVEVELGVQTGGVVDGKDVATMAQNDYAQIPKETFTVVTKHVDAVAAQSWSPDRGFINTIGSGSDFLNLL
jgi:hypothetical protein